MVGVAWWGGDLRSGEEAGEELLATLSGSSTFFAASFLSSTTFLAASFASENFSTN